MKSVHHGRSSGSDGRKRPPGADPRKQRGKLSSAELTIDELAPGGRGVSRRPDGKVVFVDGVCPGDRVAVEIDESAGARSGATVLRVLHRGPSRVEPACPIYAVCGGCDWMHIAVEMQLQLHAEMVRKLLGHATTGKGELPAIRSTAARTALDYRTRARAHVKADKRTVSVGYLAVRSHEIVDVAVCRVLDPRLAPVLGILRELFQEARGSGEVTIGLGKAHRPIVDIRFDGDLPGAFFGRLSTLCADDASPLAGARLILEGTSVPATFGDPNPMQIGADDVPVRLARGGFAQPSDEGAIVLAKLVAERAQSSGKRVVELFSGSGTLSVLLARGAHSFVGIEIEKESCEAARENLSARGITGKFVTADADAYEIPKSTELVVLDPPRSGAKGATEAIVRARVRQVVYVSCDPATLARDLRVFSDAGYVVASIDTVELFPQTSHIETVVVLERVRPGQAASVSG